ncbi:MAG: response regulator transcription factor [Deltaproteobacteria bacterium]|nr:response regulator transcription factor [Deltaproteobacteria bacterium]
MSLYNIILAEDHALVRQGIRRILEDDPKLNVVGEAEDGFELLEVVRQKNADMIILDITMPNLSGIEATKRLKANYPDIKILILTMHKGSESLSNAMASGADGYILKENASQDLIRAIRTLQEGGTYISPSLFPYLEEFFIQSHRGSHPFSDNNSLSGREIEIIKLIAEGKSSKEIAEILCLSYRTIQNHRTNILRKLNLTKSTDLVRYALRKGYISS